MVVTKTILVCPCYAILGVDIANLFIQVTDLLYIEFYDTMYKKSYDSEVLTRTTGLVTLSTPVK